jgi:hypothetical protein
VTAEKWDVDAFKDHFASLSSDDKHLVLYWLLRDLFGDRPEREADVSDPDGFVYMHFVPPGLREYFRLLQHPEIRAALDVASREEAIAHDKVLAEIGIGPAERD